MKKTLLALALLGASATASADSWIYGGANIGQADFAGEDATSYGVHVGTGILPLIGLEVGYQNHGEFDTTKYGRNVEVDSVYFAVKPSIDLGPLHVYARGGLHKWDMQGSSVKKDDVDLMYGVGAEYFVFGPISVGASYNVYQMDKEDMKTLSLNASFHFL